MKYAIAFVIATVAALSFLPGSNDAQVAVQKAHNDRCAAFAAAGIDC